MTKRFSRVLPLEARVRAVGRSDSSTPFLPMRNGYREGSIGARLDSMELVLGPGSPR